MAKVGIVCEGGGTRGAYTAGVVTWFKDNNLPIEYMTGISAGAVVGGMFASGQTERMKRFCTEYICSPRYSGIQPLIYEGQLGGINYAFEGIDAKDPLDKEAVKNSKIRFEYGLYNCESGEVEYYGNETVADDYQLYKCSCRLPGISKIGYVNGKYFIDAGVKTMIPIARSEEVGNEFNFVILTKPDNYVRKPEKWWQMFILGFTFNKRFPKVMECLRRRHLEFKEEVDYIYQRENEGKVLVLRPSKDLKVGRMCKDKALLEKMYDLGYQDCEMRKDKIMALIKRAEESN